MNHLFSIENAESGHRLCTGEVVRHGEGHAGLQADFLEVEEDLGRLGEKVSRISRIDNATDFTVTP